MTTITENDWLKLKDFADIIAPNIIRKLPIGCNFDNNDVKSAIYGVFIDLISNYKPGPLSLTSYCWKFAELKTLNVLIKEYKRIQQQLQLIDEVDDDHTQHEYGEYEVEQYKALSEHIEQKNLIDEIMSTTNVFDKQLMNRILEGATYDEISKEFGISKGTITKRLAKYKQFTNN